MTKLYLVGDGDRRLWVMALIEEDVWSYVDNTGKFHLNSGLRHDYFFENQLTYTEVGIGEAARQIAAGVGHLDEKTRAEVIQHWRDDENALAPDAVFAASVADLN